MKIHHVGYAVKDHSKAEDSFRDLGYTIGRRTNDDGRNVCISFAENDGYLIELVSPLGEGSPIDGILAKVGGTAYHICYITDDIAATLAELRPLGWRALGPASPAPALNYANVAFAHHKVAGLLELVTFTSTGQEKVL